MSDLISKEKLIQHLEKEGGMNVPAWLRENIENAPTEKVYVVGYQNATEEPVITVFDNREAAIKAYRKVVRRLIEDRRRYHEHNANKDASKT